MTTQQTSENSNTEETKKTAPKVFIATPAYSGKVNVQYALSLADTTYLLKAHGIDIVSRISASGSLLVAERNRLLEEFRRSDCTHMLCIDGDLGWPAQAVLAMLEADKEFVAGVYPARGKVNEYTFRPTLRENSSIVNDKQLLSMQYIPAGFMLIKRSVVEKLIAHFPELYFEPKDPEKASQNAYCFFNTEVWEGEFWGEDYVFCRRCREAGVDIWVDPFIQFDHDGTIGMLIERLTTDPNKA